jgi:signal transduction histidine kinase
MKLWLCFGLLILTLASLGVVSYRQIGRIENDLLRIVQTEEPLQEAILEMEINVGEMATAVLNYVWNLEPTEIEIVRDSKANFERFAARFDRLAESDEEKRLAQEVAQLSTHLRMLGDEIAMLAGQRHADLQLFMKGAKEIHKFIERKLWKVIDRASHNAIEKLEAALYMEVNINKTFATIEAYILQPNPALRKAILASEADFERFEAVYRRTGLSINEEIFLNQIDKDFAKAVQAGNEIIGITDKLDGLIKRFEMNLEKIDIILDNQIQPLIHAATVRATEDARSSAATGAVVILVMSVFGTLVGSFSALGIARGIIKPVEALATGADMIGGGILEHRIDIKAQDEFRQLAINFNKMAENLEQSTEALQEAHDTLQQRVEERTAELSNVLVTLSTSNELLKREIDEHERTEEALKRTNEVLQNFVHVVSHDLKTPITCIQGFSSALLDKHKEGLDDQGRICLERIDASALRMERLVSDLLVLSKVGRVVATFEDVSSLEIVTNATSGLQERLKAKGIGLIVEDSLPVVNCDQGRIYQVFDNLLVNAIKFMGDTKNPKIEIGYKDTGNFHQFHVRDNGIGIDPKYHREIFEMFHRLKQIEDEEGTGLGLAIVETIISEHGGQIWVESEKGKGATFYFTLAKKA